jgi:hypothetical protein
MMGGKSTRFALAALEAEFAMMVFGSRPMAEKTAAGHVSEAGLPIARFDLVIDNDATIQRLYGTVDAALAANDATGGRAAAA